MGRGGAGKKPQETYSFFKLNKEGARGGNGEKYSSSIAEGGENNK